MPVTIARGKFITLEGPEGAGKTTQIEHLQTFLESVGHETVVTREPGGTRFADRLREVLLDPDLKSICPDAETLLMFAGRADNLARVIIPALDAGKWVLCDRFTDATFAYQGGGRGVDINRIASLETWVQGNLLPDLVLIFDLPVSQGLERARKRGTADRFERETTKFFERVRDTYLHRASSNSNRYVVLDASQPRGVVTSLAIDAIARRL